MRRGALGSPTLLVIVLALIRASLLNNVGSLNNGHHGLNFRSFYLGRRCGIKSGVDVGRSDRGVGFE